VSEGGSTWQAEYRIRRPGDHVFFCEPAPYFESSEDRYIIHYSKVVVHTMGLEVGWDAEVGLKTEIVPISRPYGLWSGNVFQGVVKLKGEPVPGAEVEVAYHNRAGIAAPDEVYAIQVVKADANGVFTYAMPRAGWWGFSALSTDEEPLTGPDGRDREVEIGAVLWVRTRDME
jgi:cobalt/nickel transport protein